MKALLSIFHFCPVLREQTENKGRRDFSTAADLTEGSIGALQMTNEPQHSRKKILTFCRILVFKVMLLVLPLHGCDYCVDMLGSGLCIYAFDAKGNKVTIDKISVIRNNRKTDHKSPPEDFSWQNLGTKEKHLRCLTDANPEGHYTVFVWRKHYLLAKDVYLGKDSSGCGLDFKKMVFRFPE